MKSTKFKKVLAISAVSTLLAIALPTAAFADTTGGTGGGGGGDGTWTQQQEWRSVKGDSKQNSYTKFLNDQKINTPYVEDRLRSKGIDIGLCKRSNVIWYLKSSDSGYWAFNYTGATHGSGWRGKNGNAGSGGKKGTIENPAYQIGAAPAPEEIAAFKEWDRKHNRTSIDNVPGYVIICSGAFDLPDRKTSQTTVSYSDKDSSATFTKPYSWSSEVKRQITVGGKDPIGADNLQNQKGANVKSNYGALWDSLSTTKDKGISPDSLKSKVDAAVKKDASKDHGSLNLSEKNKAGMAEGGVLNVYEQTRMATVTAKQKVTTKSTQKCHYVQKWDTNRNVYGPMKKVSCDTPIKTSSSKSTVTKNSGTLKNSGFWQMVSVHCNQEELDALLKAGSYKVVNTGDASKGISAVLYTNKVAAQPSKLEFGDATNSNAAKAKTGKLAFYDKECPFDCTPSKTAKGASKSNGADKNVGGKGATSKGVNTNSFEFFRDNQQSAISLDVWYPKSAGVVNYDGKAPLTTTIARTATGTPALVPTKTAGGQFTMTTADGKTKLFTGKSSPTNQRNWSKSTFSNETATMFNGLQRTFNVQSTWASEKGKPQVFNAKWEYAPTVSTKVFTNGIGFGPNSAQKTGSLGTLSTPIEGKCYANFGTTTQLDTKALFQKNTGSGTTNNLDKTLVQNSGDTAKNQTNFLVNFVRSTTE